MANIRVEPLIEFVPGKEIVSLEKQLKKTKCKDKRKTGLSGEQIRDFYEGLILEETETTHKQKIVNSDSKLNSTGNNEVIRNRNRYSDPCEGRKEVQHGKTNTKGEHGVMGKSKSNKTGLRLLQSSQDGNVSNIMRCIQEGVDVNVQDQYGWTSLMCSAYAGHEQVVKILLKSGADWTICEKKGRTARDLAKQCGHQGTIKLFDYISVSPEKIYMSESDKKDEEGFYCDVCKKLFSEGSYRSHTSSTVHLFNRQLKPKEPSYLIGESNIGYQMMLRNGWNTSQGLGPRGDGNKYPVKTVLKRDREGLGGEKVNAARITHFKPGDIQAVKSVKPWGERRESVRTVSRRERRRRERRDKEWEKRLRQYMNSD